MLTSEENKLYLNKANCYICQEDIEDNSDIN